MRATITSKGQVTIPKALRDQLGLGVGACLDFSIDDEGRLMGEVVHKAGVADLAGMLHHLAKEVPVTTREMDAVISDEVARRRGLSGTGHANRPEPENGDGFR